MSLRWVEVRSYELHPGAGPRLKEVFEIQAGPC